MKNRMKNFKSLPGLIIGLLFIGLPASYAQPETIKVNGDSRQRLTFNNNWSFQTGDISGAEKTALNDQAWRSVRLPHDWSIEGEFDEHASTGGPGGYLPTGIAWYRKHFVLPETSQNVWIEFDGVYMNSEVWINEHYVGKNVYGYTSFFYDITPYIQSGENLIAVKVDNSIQRNSRWYSGSGIYRNVWLHVANPVHIPIWGTYITTPVIKDTLAIVAVRTTLENKSSQTVNAVLRSQITDAKGKVVASVESQVSILAGKQHDDYRQELPVAHPSLWSVDSPTLYTLSSSIIIGDKIVDRTDSRFGIRSLEFSAQQGFLLNGKRVKINGVNLHHDAGCLGAAVPAQVWERRLKILKEMGVNGIRTAHNPQSTEFMDLCDELGLLVMNEFVDEWMVSKEQTTAAYSLYFKENWAKDVTNFVRRDRNHPSVVFWSAGNEVRDQMYTEGIDVLRELVKLFHAEDPTRPVTQGNDQIVAEPLPAHLEFLDLLDVVGYNYVGRWRERAELYYTPDKIRHPEWKMVGTENGSARGERGAFSLGNDKNVVRPTYVSGMLAAEALWKYTATHDFVIGDFMWTGIDYLGEARWPGRGSGSGVIDMAGFPKSSFYFYQSQWTDKPMIHIFPHWNWEGREGQVIPVMVYSNCDAVELFVNGKSFGEQRLEFPSYGMAGKYPLRDRPDVVETTDDLHLMWTVPYQAGELKAVGRIRGEIVYTETVRTTGKPAALRVSTDKNTLRANGDDVAHIKVEIVDSKGNMIPTSNNEIHFTLKGEGQLLGLESGDNRSHNSGHFRHRDPSQPATKDAFGGLLLGYIQATQKAGTVTVAVSSPGLKGMEVKIVTQ
jgi:beta-galactosidase